MGASSSRGIVEYLSEDTDADRDKDNYKYYSGERFCIIPNHFYKRVEVVDETDAGYSWYTWYITGDNAS